MNFSSKKAFRQQKKAISKDDKSSSLAHSLSLQAALLEERSKWPGQEPHSILENRGPTIFERSPGPPRLLRGPHCDQINTKCVQSQAEFPNSVPVIVNANITLNFGGRAGEAISRRQQKWPLHWGCTFTIMHLK